MVTGKACERSGLWEGGIRVWSPSGKFSVYPTPTWCHLSLSVTHMLGKNMYTYEYNILSYYIILVLYFMIFYIIIYIYVYIILHACDILVGVYCFWVYVQLPKNSTATQYDFAAFANRKSPIHFSYQPHSLKQSMYIRNRTCMSGTAQNQSKQLYSLVVSCSQTWAAVNSPI